MKKIKLLALLLLFPLLLGANNRGNQGTATTDLIDRGMMDLIYHRQDGFSSSDKTLFGDPNAASALRGWRIVGSATQYYDCSLVGNGVTCNMVNTGASISFQLNGTTIFAFESHPDWDNATASDAVRFVEDSHMNDILFDTTGETVPYDFHFSSPSSSITGPISRTATGAGVTQSLNWYFHGPEVRRQQGRTQIYQYWTGKGGQANTTWGQGMRILAKNDPNAINVRWKTIAQIASTVPTLVTTVNSKWTINQTKASTDIVGFETAGTEQWKIDTSGNIVDSAGNNLVDGRDVSDPLLVPWTSYIDIKERLAVYEIHGGFLSISTANALDSVPTNITDTVGLGKIVVSVIAGSDVSGSITVTGTSVDRNTGAETASDTDVLTVDAVTTDGSDTDASGNNRYSFTGAYMTSKWFLGSVTLSTADLTLTDVDVYQIAFEQNNDNTDWDVQTFDMTALSTNASAWLYAYLYTVEPTGDKVNITRLASLELPAAKVNANLPYRLRRGNLATTLDGSTDGVFINVFPGPLASTYWEDMTIKVWTGINPH